MTLLAGDAGRVAGQSGPAGDDGAGSDSESGRTLSEKTDNLESWTRRAAKENKELFSTYPPSTVDQVGVVTVVTVVEVCGPSILP